jgi:hypothetical protein
MGGGMFIHRSEFLYYYSIVGVGYPDAREYEAML